MLQIRLNMHHFHVKKISLCTYSFTYAKSPGYLSGCSDHILFDYNNKVQNLLTEHCSTCTVQSMQYEDDKNRYALFSRSIAAIHKGNSGSPEFVSGTDC